MYKTLLKVTCGFYSKITILFSIFVYFCWFCNFFYSVNLRDYVYVFSAFMAETAATHHWNYIVLLGNSVTSNENVQLKNTFFFVIFFYVVFVLYCNLCFFYTHIHTHRTIFLYTQHNNLLIVILNSVIL